MLKISDVLCPGCNNGHLLNTVENQWGWHAQCSVCGSKVEEIGAWNRWILDDYDGWLYIALLAHTYEPDELAEAIKHGNDEDNRPDQSMWYWRDHDVAQ